ncbi:hypothetical protein M514_00843 [Trichuris suis]|uniref:Uncharacterized protein n=1 Tax=Trichuris suis TaxID=68888 RepID=A0A085MVF5_9BILA|nr:hypothetical protein M513_00843 [Trichuris suis]KFD61201.1 hypothetical protein M514_00843 [Trichuris suis]
MLYSAISQARGRERPCSDWSITSALIGSIGGPEDSRLRKLEDWRSALSERSSFVVGEVDAFVHLTISEKKWVFLRWCPEFGITRRDYVIGVNPRNSVTGNPISIGALFSRPEDA